MARADDKSAGRRLRVNGHSATWLRQGFPWVYPNEVVGSLPKPAGTEVLLESADGVVLGRALTDDAWIAARVYRTDGGLLDEAWMRTRLDDAITLRERLVLGEDTTCARLVHGENDALPGVRVDKWGDYLTVIVDTPAVRALLPLLVDALVERLAPLGVFLCYRLDSRDTRDPSQFTPAPGWLYGEAPEGGEVVVIERGMAMRVRPGEGPDVGSYPDMRDVRTWLAPHWAGRRVLNTFAYTGGFSVAAKRGGAAEAVSVDLASVSLERARANFVANGLDPDASEFLAEDTFRALDRFRRTGRRFDLVVVDPPSFSHGPEGMWSAKKDLPRLVAASVRVLDRRGLLVVASNQGQVSPREFRGAMAEGFKRAERVAREIAFLGAAVDHPALVTFPEGHYLKVGVWVLD